jgi:drug/metabolite transporter (DMT)-like permease
MTSSDSKVRFLFSVFLLAGVSAFFMAYVRWPTSQTMGIIDLVFSFLSFALLLYLRKRPQSIEKVATLALALSFILFCAVYLLATQNTTRMALFFLFTASAFFLKGRLAGRIWLGVVLAFILSRCRMKFAHP